VCLVDIDPSQDKRGDQEYRCNNQAYRRHPSTSNRGSIYRHASLLEVFPPNQRIPIGPIFKFERSIWTLHTLVHRRTGAFNTAPAADRRGKTGPG
jgi:hypothetical protein